MTPTMALRLAAQHATQKRQRAEKLEAEFQRRLKMPVVYNVRLDRYLYEDGTEIPAEDPRGSMVDWVAAGLPRRPVRGQSWMS